MVTMLKDGGEIHIYRFGDSSHKRPTHVATLHLPPPHDDCLLLVLTTMMGPFLAYPPPDVPFALARNAHVHVFTLHRGKQDAEQGRE